MRRAAALVLPAAAVAVGGVAIAANRETILVDVLDRVHPRVSPEVAMLANIAMAGIWDALQDRPEGRPWWIDPMWTWVQEWEVTPTSPSGRSLTTT